MVMKIVAISALVIAGLALTGKHVNATTAAERHWSLTSFGAAMVPVLFAYGGWQTANFLAAEVKEPKKNLPRGLLFGVLGVVLLYIGVNWVCLRALGPGALAATTTPATAVMRMALGQRGATFIAAAIATSRLLCNGRGWPVPPRDCLARSTYARTSRRHRPAECVDDRNRSLGPL
jgi:APA family basic amino acid/polyamine antiporter